MALGKRALKKQKRLSIVRMNAIKQQKHAERKAEEERERCSIDALNLSNAPNITKPKSSLCSISSNINTTVKPVITLKQKVTTSTFHVRQVSNDKKLTARNNSTIHPIRRVTAKSKGNFHDDDNSDFCLICGDVETLADAKQAVSLFQWNINGMESDPLSSDSCVDNHLLPIFVLRTLLKFPEEECVKIYEKTFGVSNPADWFILCGNCVTAAHKVYTLQVLIRQLEKKFETWQQQFVNQMKARVQNKINNKDKSSPNIVTVRDQILGFYSEKSQSDFAFNCEPEQPQASENHLFNLPSPTHFDVDVNSSLPQSSTNSPLHKPAGQNITATKRNHHKWWKTRLRIPYIPTKRDPAIRLKRLAWEKKKHELINKHKDPSMPNTYRCQLCPPEADSVFEGRNGFVTHISLAHKSVWQSVSECVQCEQCGKLLASSSVRYHVQRNHPTTCPHICHLCGAGFVLEESLKYHIGKHKTGDLEPQVKKISVCHYCGLECVSNRGLTVHIKRFHRQSGKGSKLQSTGRAGVASQRKCKHCAVVCASFRELKLHLKSLHPELFKHKCEECDAAYISRSNLQVHVSNIHRQAKLQCKNCPTVLSTAAAMCGHVKYNCRGFSNQN